MNGEKTNDVLDRITDLANKIIKDKPDNRSLYQKYKASSLSNDNDIYVLVKNRDKDNNQTKLIKHLSDFLFYNCAIWKKDDILFITDSRNMLVKYDEKLISKEICDECGINERNYINSIMTDITKRITDLCDKENRIFTDKAVRGNWRFLNFTNCLYDVCLKQPVLKNPYVIKTSCLNAKYVYEDMGSRTDGGLQEFAALCTNDIIGQKRLLQAIGYAISDYRENNRLFFFETDNIRPRQIIVSLLEKVLGKQQLARIPLDKLTKNYDLEGIKVIISTSCSSNYEETDNDRLYNLIKDTDFIYDYEEGKRHISESKRNDVVVFHFSPKLPQKYLESLYRRNANLITTIKLQGKEEVDWNKIEYKILEHSDCCITYLAEEILPKLCGSGFNLVESQEEESADKITKNPDVMIKQFINEMCLVGKPSYKIVKEDLYKAFLKYSGLTKYMPFHESMKKDPRINNEGRLGGHRAYVGITLR